MGNIMNERSNKGILLIFFAELHDICGSTGQVRNASRMPCKQPTPPLKKIGKHPDSCDEILLKLPMRLQQFVVMLMGSKLNSCI